MKKNKDALEIRLSGTGGQGMILAGIILGEAAAIFDDLHALQSQSYGPEARGGASKSDVIISRHDIEYPRVTKPDLLLALSQRACNSYSFDLTDDSILVIDSIRVTSIPKHVNCKIFKIPFGRIAREVTGREITTNIIALGAVNEILKAVTFKALERATLKRVPKGTEDINKKALRAGVDAVKNYKE
jgi:2-oxoglutarate ferredoxin oxidoreductase subunit gamma